MGQSWKLYLARDVEAVDNDGLIDLESRADPRREMLLIDSHHEFERCRGAAGGHNLMMMGKLSRCHRSKSEASRRRRSVGKNGKTEEGHRGEGASQAKQTQDGTDRQSEQMDTNSKGYRFAGGRYDSTSTVGPSPSSSVSSLILQARASKKKVILAARDRAGSSVFH